MNCKFIFQKLIILKARLAAYFSHLSLLSHFFSLILTLFMSSILVPSSHSADITLAWDHNDQVPVTGYYVYHGPESGYYTAKIDAGSEPQYTLVGLDDLQSYYIAVTAYNEFGESDFSEEIIYASQACDADIDFDGDIDGTDLVLYAEDASAMNLATFSLKFGGTNCP